MKLSETLSGLAETALQKDAPKTYIQLEFLVAIARLIESEETRNGLEELIRWAVRIAFDEWMAQSFWEEDEDVQSDRDTQESS